MNDMSEAKKVVIVGGGITGLSAAFYLQKEAKEKGLPVDVLLIEASDKLGGKIQTVHRDGFVIERGPDSFLIRKKSMSDLAKDVGIGDELVRNATGQAYIFLNGELHPIPAGSVMGIPTEPGPFLSSDLFSLAGKARVAADLILPRSNVKGDQSLGEFFRRRFGTQMVENLIEPLLSGIYAGDIDELSLEATYPQFKTLETKHRSLILGSRKTTPKKVAVNQGTGAAKQGVFYSFRNGLESLVDAIEKKLEPNTVLKNIRVAAIRKEGDKTVLELNNGETVEADAVILTTGHEVVGSLFEPYGILKGLKSLPTTSVATVAMAFSEGDVIPGKEGTGFLVARNNDMTITACTWVNLKWPTTTPEGKVLLRSFVGRPGNEAVVDLSDDEIKNIVLEDLRKVIQVKNDPEFTIVTRFKEGRPQYRVGHKQRIEAARAELRELFPNVKLAGATYEGVGLPDCIDQGKAAVQEVLDDLFA